LKSGEVNECQVQQYGNYRQQLQAIQDLGTSMQIIEDLVGPFLARL
jgi:hypothetical protein